MIQLQFRIVGPDGVEAEKSLAMTEAEVARSDTRTLVTAWVDALMGEWRMGDDDANGD